MDEENKRAIDVCFTPDNQFILACLGGINIYRIDLRYLIYNPIYQFHKENPLIAGVLDS